MSNKIVQLENEAGDNIYPLAGGALTGSISKTMLEEGVFEGPELSEPSTVAYVATDNIQDGAVTSDKIDWTTIQNIDVTSYFSIQVTQPVTRAYVTIFGKIGFVNIAFAPINNLNGEIIRLPDSLGIKPIYTTELNARVGDSDTRRGLIGVSGTNTFLSINQHSSSAGKFCTLFGMFFLQ